MTRRASTRGPSTRRRSIASSVCCAFAIVTMFGASPAFAQDEDADSRPDARLMGYPSGTEVAQGTSTTSSYLIAIVLGAIAVAIMFKSSGRTHLD